VYAEIIFTAKKCPEFFNRNVTSPPGFSHSQALFERGLKKEVVSIERT